MSTHSMSIAMKKSDELQDFSFPIHKFFLSKKEKSFQNRKISCFFWKISQSNRIMNIVLPSTKTRRYENRIEKIASIHTPGPVVHSLSFSRGLLSFNDCFISICLLFAGPFLFLHSGHPLQRRARQRPPKRRCDSTDTDEHFHTGFDTD